MPIAVDPPGRRLRQRPGLDPGAADPGRGRGPGRVPERLRQVHRRGHAGPAQERGAAGRPVSGLCRPGAIPRRWRGRSSRPRSPTSGRCLMRSLRSQPRARPARSTRDDDRSRAARATRASDEPAARDMAEMLARVATAPDPGVLLGLEGQAAALYFANFGRMLKAKAPARRFDFTTPQPPPAPRPGERALELRLCVAGQGLLLGGVHGRIRSVSGFLPHRPPRPALAGAWT